MHVLNIYFHISNTNTQHTTPDMHIFTFTGIICLIFELKLYQGPYKPLIDLRFADLLIVLAAHTYIFLIFTFTYYYHVI